MSRQHCPTQTSLLNSDTHWSKYQQSFEVDTRRSRAFGAAVRPFHGERCTCSLGLTRASNCAGRSAIVVLREPRLRAYRIKGCGNYVDGEYAGKSLRYPFPGMPVVPSGKVDMMTFEPDPHAVEVRGCAFPHTAARELLMAAALQRALSTHGLHAGLEPVAVSMFAADFAGHGVTPLPRLPKAAAISSTLGERRVASHVLPGISVLLPLLFPSAVATTMSGEGSSEESLTSLLPPTRRSPQEMPLYDENGLLVRTLRFGVTPTFLGLDSLADVATVEPVLAALEASVAVPALPRSIASTSTSSPEASEHADAAAMASTTVDAEITAPRRESSWQGRAWDAARAKLADAMVALRGVSIVTRLIWRLGEEMGRVRGLMTAAHISWGNYIDHTPEPHNNSHPNNFVVVCPLLVEGPSPLVAPVDLDMSSFRDHYLDLMAGEEQPDEFDQAVAREANELRANLAGRNDSTGLAGISIIDDSQPLGQQALAWVLRDVLIRGFDHGLLACEGGPPPLPALSAEQSVALDAAQRALLELALVLSAQCTS